MKDKDEQDFFILQTIEVALIGLFSLASIDGQGDGNKFFDFRYL